MVASAAVEPPSPRAVAAAAAATVLDRLFNRERDRIVGELAAQSERGSPAATTVGRRVGQLVLAHFSDDGALDSDDPLPSGAGVWTGVNPTAPGVAHWRPWFLASVDEAAPEPPYSLGSPEDRRDLDEVVRVAWHHGQADVAIVHKWADTPPPTLWDDLLDERIERRALDPLAAARAEVYLNGAMYDAFIVCWCAKFKYWVARPFQRVAELPTVVTTPNFPSYTSGHATVSGAAAGVLGALFADERRYFSAEADEAARSRLLAGIHFRHDNEAGLASGRRVADLVVAIMRRDGVL
jgi:hypothetical protein